MRGGLHCHIDRHPADVFEFLADLRNERKWNPRVVEIQKTSPGPIRAGATFRGTYKGPGVLETELLDHDPPHRLSFRSRGPRMTIEGAFRLRPRGSGTDVDLDAVFRPHGPFRALTPVMAVVMKRQNEAAGRRLVKALAQRG